MEEKHRTDYISWDEYFMGIAQLSALRSKDPSTQVGACIVDKAHKVVSIGYNGMPVGVDDERIPWGHGEGLESKYLYVCHAELNAILNTRDSAHLNGCTLYVTLRTSDELRRHSSIFKRQRPHDVPLRKRRMGPFREEDQAQY